MLRFETNERTGEVLRRVQESGETWMSGTAWDGPAAILISVCNWSTDDADVARGLAAFRAAVG